jgi:hypothetical protein
MMARANHFCKKEIGRLGSGGDEVFARRESFIAEQRLYEHGFLKIGRAG